MKKISGVLVAATLVLLAFASVAFAQQAGPEGNVIIRQRVMQGPEGGPPPPPDANFVFIASESFGGKVVKGAPYSGEGCYGNDPDSLRRQSHHQPHDEFSLSRW